MRRAILLVICATLSAAQTPTQKDPELEKFLGRRILPVDQAIGQPSLVAFRASLVAAIARHDLKFLLSNMDPAVEGCGWKGFDGFRGFLTEFDLWDEFQNSLELGGVMHSPTVFRSNYTMINFPRGADMTEFLVVIKPDAAVHEKPSLTSTILSRLRYEMVLPVGEATAWQEIEYRPGKTGYIRANDVQSPTGYSFRLELRKGKWQIVWIASYCD